jgi:hypothetical protein
VFAAQDYCSEYDRDLFFTLNETILTPWGTRKDSTITIINTYNGTQTSVKRENNNYQFIPIKECHYDQIYRAWVTDNYTTVVFTYRVANESDSTNVLGTAKTTVVYTCKYKEYNYLLSIFITCSAPLSIILQQSMTVIKNTTVQINCTATGNPPPILEWINFPNSDRFNIYTVSMPEYPSTHSDTSSITILEIGNNSEGMK